MTDQPKTMQLSANEWRVLVATGMNGVYSFVTTVSGEVPTPEQVQWMHQTLDRLKMQVSAWYASAPRPELDDPVHEVEPTEDTVDYGDAAPAPEPSPLSMRPPKPAAMKRSRGWPKGKKRGPRRARQNAGVMQ